jgi:RimJ/RimL family protein N-acetyltransferase
MKLRSLEREDLKQLRDWRNDPDIFSRVREYRFLNMENQEAWFNSLRDNRNIIMFGVETECQRVWRNALDQYKLIGVCGLTNIDWITRKAEVSIYIGDKEFRGKGLGVEILNALANYAFNECNLNKLWAEIFAYNIVGEKVFIKAGYKYEGKLRCHAYKSGMFVHCYIYGLLRKEYQLTGIHISSPVFYKEGEIN